MSIVAHLHHLFHPETCQSYIHMLRWKDRPLQCPRCQSHNVGKPRHDILSTSVH
jgi:predicted Zn-ribbon and HTH transcriptional regulator